ncbi:MAG TPA: hypothetical protein DEB23_06985 [Chitinophagaceae bacterium]|jgi:hypothetical protein|nr:hypothetical protein [Chitinophagaceae bacterium]
MNKVIYLIFVLLVTINLSSCTKKFEELNTDPTQFINATPEALLAVSVKRTGDWVGATGLNNGINVNMWEIANFGSAVGRYANGDQGVWQNFYVNILQNINQIETQFGKDTLYKNRVQIARIWKAYVYSILTGYFGSIPLTEANNTNYLTEIKFESEDSAYIKILGILKTASTTINVNNTKDKLAYDVVYGNSGTQLQNWVKFANTLRLKIALRCRRNLGALADAEIRDVMTNEAALIGSENETAKVAYENVIGNENPYYKTYIRSNFTSFFPRMSDMMFMYLRSYKDPRIDYYFDSVKLANRYRITDTVSSTINDSLYIVTYPMPHYGIAKSKVLLPGWTPQLTGGVDPQLASANNGGINGVSAYSMFSLKILNNPTRPLIVLSFAEAQFLKAQARIQNLGGNQTAENYYNSGIDANFAFWGIPATLRDKYKAGNGVKFGTTGTGLWNYLHLVNADIPAGDINKIYHQLWLNYFPDQPFDGWCLQRQTRVLNLSPHTNPSYASLLFQDIPGRGVYPSSVSTLNPVGYDGALKHLGIPNYTEETTNPYNDLKFAVPYKVPDFNAKRVYYDLSGMNKWYGTTIQSVRAAGLASGFSVIVTKTYKP